ncbi:MAG TPA: HEAT repeat domain-containing protein [Halomicronema sp.]
MNQNRKPRGVKATTEGRKKLNEAKAKLQDKDGKKLTYPVIAELAELQDRKTVERFFGGKENVDLNSAIAICEALGLDINDLIDPPTPPPPPPEINWREKCQEILETRRQLASNLFTTGTDIILNLDDTHVPLGLIQRKPQPKNDCPSQEGSKVYGISNQEEKITSISYDEFFSNVLAKGNSPKSQGKRLSIVGEPGAGKTTQLLKIADWVKTEKLPVWVSLAEVGAKNLDDYLREDWLNRAFGKAKATEIQAEFEQLLSDGKVWLILDGADEMGMSDPLGKLAQSLRFAVFKNVPVVLSCRLNFWEAAANALFDFDTYKMLDFSYGEANKVDQVNLFINKWFRAPSMPLENQKLGKELRQALDEPGKERIKDLARNPLRLSLLCLTWKFLKGNLPDTKAELYEVFVEALYELKKGIFPTDSSLRSRLNRALGQLGLKAINAGYNSILPDWLVNEALAKPHPELFEEAIKLGWLNRVGVDAQNPLKSVYAFYHPTFQEYFAACEIENGEYLLKPVVGNPQEGCYRIFEKQWKEVFLLWLGRKDVGKDKKEDLIAALWNFEDECDQFYRYRAVFLAAVGISEFKECAFADAIVFVILCLGFGYFNEEEQRLVTTYLDPIAEGAREILKETHRQQAIDALAYLLAKTKDKETDSRLGESWVKIAVGNQKAIDALVDLLAKTEDESTRWGLAATLGKIDPGNQKAIDALVDLLANTNDKETGSQVAKSLGEIAVGNQNAIDALVDLLANTKDENTCRDVAKILGEIAVGNQKTIDVLIDLLANTEDKITRWRVAKSLGKIAVGNQKAIDALVYLLANTEDKITRWRVAKSLSKIAVGNQKAIDALVYLLANTENVFTGQRVIECLGEIAVGNQKAIDALVYLLAKTEDESTRWRVAKSLGEIAVGNQKAIDSLVDLLANTKDESTRWRVAYSLGEIAVGNQKAIDALVDLFPKTEDKYTRLQVAESLDKIDPGNEKSIDALVDLLAQTKDESTGWRVAYSLQKILEDKKQFLPAVTRLKNYFTSETYESNFDLYEKTFKLIFHCAQNLTYPDFYTAWHYQPPTHPEMQDITGTGITPTTQHYNLENLPQILTQTLNNHPEINNKIKLLIIDASKFLDPENPASEIYDQMLDQNCPERQNGEPETLQNLKTYCSQLRRQLQQNLVFIYYEKPSTPLPQGFSQTFLNDLTKFDTPVCILSEKTDIPLQTFNPTDPNLIENIIGWITALVLEN